MFSLRVQAEGGPRAISPEDVPSTSDEGLPTEMPFTSGNPTVVHGKVHLYRPIGPLNTDQEPDKPGTSRQVCILAVPSGMGVPEFCQFVGAYLPKVTELRFLRGGGGGAMALLLFDTEATATDFIEIYDGRKFNTLEPDVCRAVLVSSVEITRVESGAPGPSAPTLPPPGQTELPNCPVCLERLDQHVSGITTTVCQHNFHTDCLMKWTDSSCPVCRYCHEESEQSACMECGNTEDLWICLICGYVGCGRYQNKHSVAHWQETQHCYSLELATQRVWDYVGDNYVHRLIQTSTDGKLVELPSPQMERASGGGGESCSGGGDGADGEMAKAMLSSKIEAVAFEYNHLLTSQLESQRMYYEGLLKLAEEEVGRMRAREARLEARLQESEEAARTEAKENRELERKRGQLERRLEEAVRGQEEVAKEKDFLKQVSDSLIGNQKEWQRKAEEAAAGERAKEVKELEEQVRDLMVFIEAQSTLKNAEGSSELQDGTVLGVSPSPESMRRKGKGRAR